MRIHSIFESISGEAGIFPQGTWCTFIRLQGCNLRCQWCDTIDAQEYGGGHDLSVDEIVSLVRTHYVVITGGEPLTHEIPHLLDALWGHKVQVETNGSLPPPLNKSRAGWVVDYKCPSSGMHDSMPSADEFCKNWRDTMMVVKFVIDFQSKSDLQFAIAKVEEMEASSFPPMRYLISPLDASAKEGLIKSVVEEIKNKNPKLLDLVIFSVQLHKLLGLP